MVFVKRTGEVVLQAHAAAASCSRDSIDGAEDGALTLPSMVWTWEASTQSVVAGYSPRYSPDVILDADSKTLRRLNVRGSSLPFTGIAYTIRVTGCVRSVSPALCASAETSVTLLDETLQGGIVGGDRTVGSADPFELDACSTLDPDEELARCNEGRDFCGTLSFTWSCLLMTDGTIPTSCPDKLLYPRTTECIFKVRPNLLPPGLYAFQVAITNGGEGNALTSYVAVTVKEGRLPSLSIEPLARKHNPAARLVLYGQLDGSSYPTERASALHYRWEVQPPIIDLTNENVTIGGPFHRVLVLRPNMLVSHLVQHLTLCICQHLYHTSSTCCFDSLAGSLWMANSPFDSRQAMACKQTPPKILLPSLRRLLRSLFGSIAPRRWARYICSTFHLPLLLRRASVSHHLIG